MRASICSHNLQHGFYCICRAFCTMDNDTITLRTSDELIEICVEMLDHVRADGMRLLTPLAPIRERLKRADASLYPAFGVGIQRNLQCWACYSLTDSLTECSHDSSCVF